MERYRDRGERPDCARRGQSLLSATRRGLRIPSGQRTVHSLHLEGGRGYYNVLVEGQGNQDAAWYYPAPFAAASEIKDYVAFWKEVQITGTNPGEAEILPPAR